METQQITSFFAGKALVTRLWPCSKVNTALFLWNNNKMLTSDHVAPLVTGQTSVLLCDFENIFNLCLSLAK